LTALGDLKDWTSRFRTLDERLLERILAVWPKCLAVLPCQPIEDRITINLVACLSKDAIVRRICFYIEYQFEPFGTAANGAKFSKGQIDLGVLLDWDRERYLAYECKRLNVIYNGQRSSLATEYVKEGMMRFLTEQYADGLPIGCMLGFVMDGDIVFAMAQLNSAIQAHNVPLALVSGPTTAPSIGGITRFLTEHQRPTHLIELRHALLPFSEQGV
jgi:hypothetical protein